MQLYTPHPPGPLLLGFAVFRNRVKLDNLRSFHIYKKESFLHTIQQEFQSKAAALREICPPIHYACICESAALVKEYMELLTAKQRTVGWQCMLDFFTTPPRGDSHSSLTETELLVANAWSIANSLCINANNAISWEGPRCIFPSIPAYMRECESFEPIFSNHSTGELTEGATQRLQLDVWQQWGSDLELASPRLSRAFELPLLRNHSSNESNDVYRDSPSPLSSSLSSSVRSNNVDSLHWAMQTSLTQSPKRSNIVMCPPSDETLGVDSTGVTCTSISSQSNFETLLGPSPNNCNFFANVLPLDLNQIALEDAVDLPDDKQMNGYHNQSIDCCMSQLMSSASNSFSSGDERGFDVENVENYNDFRGLKTANFKKAKLNAKFHKSGSSRADSGRLSKLTKAELAHYFNMPIMQASKELNVGLTVLKKRCRIFGIPRWPHRKMKSINGLIQSIQDLVKTDISRDNSKDSDQVQVAVEELEKQKKEMQECPSTQLPERTKRLRQACFKASYRKRRQVLHDHEAHDGHDHQNAPTHVNHSNGSIFFFPHCA